MAGWVSPGVSAAFFPKPVRPTPDRFKGAQLRVPKPSGGKSSANKE